MRSEFGRAAGDAVQCAALRGVSGAADLVAWQGANRSHAGRHGEDSQRGHAAKDAVPGTLRSA
ncbi:MAG: hypothetical protein LT103_06465, partial [Burkholderiaceae bacterium]|nr:hypothetical protein [Burkholderiaceae bacterium]